MDGRCGLCQWTRARIEPFDTDSRLRFLDCNEPEIAAQAPFSPEELAREMHVRTPDGVWHVGFAGWIAILQAMPLLRWLGWLFSRKALRRAGPRFYRWLAANRYRFGAPRECRLPEGSDRFTPTEANRPAAAIHRAK